MIDYISVIKYLDKDKPFLGHCCQFAQYVTGWQCFYFEGCERLKVLWNPEAKLLRVQGSIMYFWQGHNFTCKLPDLIEALEFLQRVLQVGLWDSEIEAFEYGAVLPVELKPKYYIQNHHAAAGLKLVENEKGRDCGSFKWWEGAGEKLKMYDAKKNIQQKQGLERRVLLEEAGWNPEGQYLKFEVHFTKPSMLMAGGKALLLESLINPAFNRKLQLLLIQQYKLLSPMKTLKTPTDKKNLTTADFLLLAYLEGCMNTEGITLQAAHKELCRRLNMIPEAVLTKPDKDSRRRQINALFAKVEEEPCSQWDLTAKLKEALAGEQI